jgi:hypothetical protein
MQGDKMCPKLPFLRATLQVYLPNLAIGEEDHPSRVYAVPGRKLQRTPFYLKPHFAHASPRRQQRRKKQIVLQILSIEDLV